MSDEVTCPRCGSRNPEDANFCPSCGADLARARADSTTAMHPVTEADAVDDDLHLEPESLPEGMGMVVVKRGPNAGSRFALERDVTTAGRHPDSVIFLDDITVSRRHAEIVRGPDGYRLRDAGSLNGTYLNRERIDDAPLGDGDELQIGKYKLLFLLPES